MALRNSHIAILLLLLAAACSRPGGDYYFISAETARENGGAYRFSFVPDKEDNYTTTLAARVIRSRIAADSLEFDIHITPPAGEAVIERQAFPLLASEGVTIRLGAGSVTDYEWPWHEIATEGYPGGEWTLSIAPSDPALAEAIYGIGFSYERKIWEKEN